jgi:hypothetical protein
MNLYSTIETISILLKSAAYLDPGSGSYIIQLIIAGFMGALFMLGIYWRRVKAYLKNIFSKEDLSRKDE